MAGYHFKFNMIPIIIIVAIMAWVAVTIWGCN